MPALQGAEREKERGLILLGHWPLYPVLPVVRDWQDDPPGGLIFWKPEDNRDVDVYIFNLWSCAEKRKRMGWEDQDITWPQMLEGEQVIHYDSLDAFFDAGWRCD